VIRNFLSVTKELNSLEIIVYESSGGEKDAFGASSECLSILTERSKGTLRHLRVLGFDDFPGAIMKLQLFNSLKFLCLAFYSLSLLSAESEQ